MRREALALCLCFVAAICPDVAAAAGTTAGDHSPAWSQRVAPSYFGDQAGRLASATIHIADPRPSRLLIDRISVDAKIEGRGLDAGRNLAAPDDYRDVAWYNLGPAPGQAGNAIINGHVNWWTGSAVFTRLESLRPGDEVVIVRADDKRLTFKVTSSTIVVAGARVASLFAPSTEATLTLITCTGAWDKSKQSDTHRLLVSAVLV
jgi:LPXTG-site transpeptidase (sortase) family protein